MLGVLRAGDDARRTLARSRRWPTSTGLVESRGPPASPVPAATTARRRRLPRRSQRAAYRVVQEALTNVHKHAAGAADRRSCVRYRPDAAGGGASRNETGAPPPGPALPGGGPAWSGLRERVALLGGTLRTAGPRLGRLAFDGGGCRRPAAEDAGVIRVLLVDDEALVRAGLRMILESAGDIAVVGEADDGADAVEAVARGTGPTWC